MEWLFGRHFWVVRLILLTAIAVLCAFIVNAYVEGWLFERFLVTPKKMKYAFEKHAFVERNFNLINERNLFQSKREKVQIEDVEEGEEEQNVGNCERYESATLSSMRLRLVGTAVSELPTQSIALIDDQGGKGVRNYSINDCFAGFESDPIAASILGAIADASVLNVCNEINGGQGIIQRIEPYRVYFYNKNERRCEYLEVQQSSLDAGSYVPPSFAQRGMAPVGVLEEGMPGKIGEPGGYGSGVRKTGPTSYEIPGEELDNALGDLATITTQARLVPAFESGKPVGFRVFSIQPNSVFAKLGLQNGDTILKANGYDLNNPATSLSLLEKLKTEQRFTIDLKRGESPITFDYTVKR